MDNDDFDEDDVDAVVLAALGELLNIASGVADLQTTDEAAEEIYAICDLVAEYYQLSRVIAVTEELEDGSGYITRFQEHTGSGEPADTSTSPSRGSAPIPGSIRTHGKPKLRLVDSTPPKKPKA